MTDYCGNEFYPIEMDRLILMLHTAKPACFEYRFNLIMDTIQVIFYDKTGNRIGDAVCHAGSYGHEHGLIEIMGFGVRDENGEEEVLGYLTAEEVLNRAIKFVIEKDYGFEDKF